MWLKLKTSGKTRKYALLCDSTSYYGFGIRFCQLSLWGVLVEQSDKNTSCAFILNQWTTSLLEKTGNITNALEGMLENSLHGLNLNVDQPIKTSNRNNKILKV